jgi:cysteinyl-tRNA synthetase
MTLKLHNTLTRKTEDFTPITDEKVTLYTCGPTVYNYLTVGNWVPYIYWDTLVRTLAADGYKVERVMNITDVGHLVSDEDEGEDKLEKGARREGKTAWQVAEFYAEDFLAGMEKLGLTMPEHVVRATDFIPQQLDLVRVLQEKGFTYQITDGIYFDTSKFSTYADFARLDLDAQKAGARVEFNPEKRNPSDFALWKFTPAGEKRDMEWETPEDLLENSEHKMGFPGWHLECSAMAMSILDPTIDIHTGGIDHIPVHHTNEIAQSESATGKPFAHYWLHNNHLKVNGTKISKSLGNGYTLQDLAEKGFSPLDFRMFILQSHYSNEGNFTFENLEAAKNRLAHWKNVAALRHQVHATVERPDENDPSLAVIGAIKEALNDNLNTPEALRLVDEVFSHLESHRIEKIDQQSFDDVLETIDDLLGLQLQNTTPDISEDAKRLIIERERAREDKDWQKSDELRDTLKEQGITVRDTSDGSVWEYTD